MSKNKTISEKEWFPILMEEYKSLRQESLNAENNAQSLLKFGMTAVSFIVAAGITFWNNNLIPTLVFLIFIPLICYLILTIWVGEFARRMRAGQFIVDNIEKKINEICDKSQFPHALYWESYLREKSNEGKNKLFVWNRYATIFIFLGTAFSSIVVGDYRIWEKFKDWQILIININELIVLIIIIIFNYKIGVKLQKT